MKRFLFCILLVLSALKGYGAKTCLSVFQINIWNDAAMVPGGFDGLADEIARLRPDIVLLCEIRNNGSSFITRMQQALQERKANYENGLSEGNVGILSKYAMERDSLRGSDPATDGAALKVRIRVGGTETVVYSAHLDYTHYACYLPRGYDGVSWEKLEAPVTDAESIEKMNDESLRDEAIGRIIEDAEHEKGHFLILGGDFNEPSRSDWDERTRHMRDHRGATVNWICSALLDEAGFKDSYRTRYPDPITHPGFTYGIDNPDVSLDKLDWVPEADGRDRIDFIYYRPVSGVKLKDAMVVGPTGYIVRGRRIEERTRDKIVAPSGKWPSDHNGVLAVFTLR